MSRVVAGQLNKQGWGSLQMHAMHTGLGFSTLLLFGYAWAHFSVEFPASLDSWSATMRRGLM